MSFSIDTQTYKDIEVFTSEKNTPSIFGFYNRTDTIGGQELLYKIIRTPFSDKDFLENRKDEIRFFNNLSFSLNLSRRQLDYIEFYLKSRRIPLKNNFIDAAKDSISHKLKSNSDYYTIGEGIIHLSNVLKEFGEFIVDTIDDLPSKALQKDFKNALSLIQSNPLSKLLKDIPDDFRKLKAKNISLLDNFYRDKRAQEIKKVLSTVYMVDVLQTLSKLLENECFSLPEYSTNEMPVFEVVDGIHPLLENPVQNSIALDATHSLCFITGPNMSGKSTFLKTIGILTYIAHLGIPVPARRLVIPVLNGLFTTINLPDSIHKGYSHFQAEVNRVKEMAKQLETNSSFVVVLDELFRGTNVKDAYDGTLLVVKSLSKIKGAFFFVSTHILEAAEQLSKSDKVKFKCFESILNKDKPIYDYKLKEGVSSERIGMQIIKSEGVADILQGIIEKQCNEQVG